MGWVRWGSMEGVGYVQSGACFCRTPVYFNSTEQQLTSRSLQMRSLLRSERIEFGQ